MISFKQLQQITNPSQQDEIQPAQNLDPSKVKFRLILSDGGTKIAAICTLKILDPIIEILKEFTIIEVKQFKVVQLEGREILMLTSCPKIIDCSRSAPVGDPTNYTRQELQQPLVLSKERPGTFAEESKQSQVAMSDIQNALSQQTEKGLADGIIPIKNLNMASGDDWTIKAQITKKGKKISYQNGFLFKIDLIDEEGTQIEGTFYKDCADEFFPKLEEGKIYLFSKSQVTTANKKFTSIQNDYRIIFNEKTVVLEHKQNEQKEVPIFQKLKFNLISIGHILSEIHELKSLDVCGVVHSSVQNEGIEVKFEHGKGNVKGKMVFSIIDRMNDMITVYLWGDLSRETKVREGDVIIINGARVSQFGGKSLSCSIEHCKIYINPEEESVSDELSKYVDLRRCRAYRERYDQERAVMAESKQMDFQQKQKAEISHKKQMLDQIKSQTHTFVKNLLKDHCCNSDGATVPDMNLSEPLNKSGVYCLQGYITKFLTPLDQIAYMGCPKCLKKVTDNRLTGFYCNHCNQIIKEKYFYFIHAIFEDFTDKVIIGFSREQAFDLLGGIDASTFMTEIRRGFRNDNDFDDWLMENILYKTIKVLVKAKQETYKGESRHRFYALDVQYVQISESEEDKIRAIKTGRNVVQEATLKSENRVLLDTLSQEKEDAQHHDSLNGTQ
ncbi:hypothetical protein FGO68_gene2808 [Halteria grandinella]|uniref:Replication protein A n=1 Tax=Halteria grandinella TaxID=5974 RepID=A0A8J8NVQ7_HALGN|nr:hypothetical protein FGO68_gene2808 [Halteria grandinella]